MDKYTERPTRPVTDNPDGFIPGTTANATPPQDVIEAVATQAHAAWCGWMEYLFAKGETNDPGEVILPGWAVERWRRQMRTAYPDLPEDEKESDRKEARRYLAAAQHQHAPPQDVECKSHVYRQHDDGVWRCRKCNHPRPPQDVKRPLKYLRDAPNMRGKDEFYFVPRADAWMDAEHTARVADKAEYANALSLGYRSIRALTEERNKEQAARVEAEEEIKRLKGDIQTMVNKAADKHLAGYRELGTKLASREQTIDYLEGLLRRSRLRLSQLTKGTDGPGDFSDALALVGELDAAIGEKPTVGDSEFDQHMGQGEEKL